MQCILRYGRVRAAVLEVFAELDTVGRRVMVWGTSAMMLYLILGQNLATSVRFHLKHEYVFHNRRKRFALGAHAFL